MTELLSYSAKNSFARKLTSTLTLLGISLVVFVFCAVLMLSNGLRETLVATGSSNNVIVVRKAANTEIVSIVGRESADIVKADQAVARREDGTPIFTNEIVVVINMTKKGKTEPTNVTVRGVGQMSNVLRPTVKVTEGRWWNQGTSEVIIGKKIAEGFQGAAIGSTLRFGGRDWNVVGIYSSNGSGFESEIWGDIDQMMAAFERPVFSSLTFQLAPGSTAEEVEARLESDPRLTLDVLPEKEYYRRQSETFTRFISILGIAISVIFSLGAIVGAMITMYAAVANRTIEIGTLRALGFSRSSVLFAFLVESLIISFVGGAVGIALASLLSFMQVSTNNFDTFAEIAFTFKMSPAIIISSMVFSVVMGIVGGFFPAVRASRMKIISALRTR